MLTIQEIIAEADVLVPNPYSNTEKIAWLNAINQEFFDVVKIPNTETFSSVTGIKTYTLTGNIKEKSIDKVMIGNLKYRSLNYEDVQPAQNWYTFNNATKLLTLSTAASQSGITGIVRFYQVALTNFATGTVGTDVPDAPAEYHWIYVLGLAEYIAKANKQEENVSKYGDQYRNALATAAKNYPKEIAK
jgi:hypothetical protein